MSLPRDRFWDFQVTKIDSPTRQPLCPGRPASVPLRHTIVNSALATQHSHKWLDGVSDVILDPLWRSRKTGIQNYLRLSGTTSLRVRSCMASLASCDWIQQQLNLCITGATETGKTRLACALGNQACRQGHTVRYLRLPRLFEMLRITHGEGSYPRLMNQLAKMDLLILDDWGLQKLNAPQRNDLKEIIEDRYKLRSTLIASQLPMVHWHDYVGEATLADAILDRLLHNAHRLLLEGESMRKKINKID